MRQLRRAALNPLRDLFALFPDLPSPRVSLKSSFEGDTIRNIRAVAQSTRAAVVENHRVTVHRRRAAVRKRLPRSR